jgi:hypothetical protein
MSREARVWLAICLVSGGFLLYRGAFSDAGLGRIYVKPVTARPTITSEAPGAEAAADEVPQPAREAAAEGAQGNAPGADAGAAANPGGPAAIPAPLVGEGQAWETARRGESGARVSIPRTVGLWLAAFFTLAIFSFLYRDNPCYRFAEAVMVGVSAGYAMVAGFWDALFPKLIARLAPATSQFLTGQREVAPVDWWALIPLALGVLLLLRLASFVEADFVAQIRQSIIPLAVFDRNGQFDIWQSLQAVLMIVGLLSALCYFFYSLPHKGLYGRVARVGVWYLMITFGASFAFTVMGRIALLAARLEFLFDDWLWLIDPLSRRGTGG